MITNELFNIYKKEMLQFFNENPEAKISDCVEYIQSLKNDESYKDIIINNWFKQYHNKYVMFEDSYTNSYVLCYINPKYFNSEYASTFIYTDSYRLFFENDRLCDIVKNNIEDIYYIDDFPHERSIAPIYKNMQIVTSEFFKEIQALHITAINKYNTIINTHNIIIK